jgi:hypothetical protein
MTDASPLFEEQLRAAVRTPQPSAKFLAGLRNRLAVENLPPVSWTERVRLMLRRPVWVTTLAMTLLIAAFFIAGPERVVTAMREWFGYIPGAGIVDTNTPIRVLAEPVTVEKNGVAIRVISAVLSGSGTHIDYQVTGVSASAYPGQNDLGCTRSGYLRLPDGNQLGYDASVSLSNPTKMNLLAVPTDVNEAMLVIPCIIRTSPGSVPENWEIPLRFTPAPSDLAIIPVIEVSPSPQSHPLEPRTPDEKNAPLVSPEDSAVTVNKFIKTADGYILLGRVRTPAGESTVPSGAFEIRDATGKIVDHAYPSDIYLDQTVENPDEFPWATQIKAGDLAYPLTIRFPMQTVYQPDPSATAEFEFDAGPNPQANQELATQQEVQLLGHTLKLISLKVGPQNGYDFKFQADPEVYGASVQIKGYTSLGVLGGGIEDNAFERGLAFTQTPTGRLTVIVSRLTLIEKALTLQGQWSPQ